MKYFKALAEIIIIMYSLNVYSQDVSYQGYLASPDGDPMNGLHSLTFKVLDPASNSNLDWEQSGQFLLNKGVFFVKLGDQNSGSNKSFPQQLSSNAILTIYCDNQMIQQVPLTGKVNKPEKSRENQLLGGNNDQILGAKTLLIDIDKGGANDNEVLTWIRAENSWRPHTPQQGGNGTTGVNTINNQKGNVTLEVSPPLILNQSTGKMALSIDNTQSSTVDIPIGSIVAFFGKSNRIPDGWLLCDGQGFDETKYTQLRDILLDLGMQSGKIPDLRGQFLRGSDMSALGRGNNDPDFSNRNGTGEKIGTIQTDAFQGHWHSFLYMTGGTGGSDGWIQYNANVWGVKDKNDTPNIQITNAHKGANIVTDAQTGTGPSGIPRFTSETRPKNVYVNWIIKAK